MDTPIVASESQIYKIPIIWKVWFFIVGWMILHSLSTTKSSHPLPTDECSGLNFYVCVGGMSVRPLSPLLEALVSPVHECYSEGLVEIFGDVTSPFTQVAILRYLEAGANVLYNGSGRKKLCYGKEYLNAVQSQCLLFKHNATHPGRGIVSVSSEGVGIHPGYPTH